MSSEDLKTQVKEIVDQRLMDLGLLPEKSCVRCEHYHKGECLLFSAVIPAEFAKQGCDQWQELIPF